MITSWREKKVLVTGGSGFIGHATVQKLKERGVQDKNLFIPSSKDYDLRKETEVIRLFTDFKPNVVFHLAARVGGIYANMTAKAEFFYDNIMMNTLMTEYSYRNGVEKMMLMGSGCIYPKFASMPVKEEELWNGAPEETNAPYAHAKRVLIVQSMAYREQHGFNSVYVLPGNVYGPYDNFNLRNSHVVPALVRKFVEAINANAPSVTVWGDGSPTRDFIYVDDVAEGMMLTMEKWDSSEPLNLSDGKEMTIKALVELIKELTGFIGEVIWDTSKPNGQPRKALDTSRAREVIGFKKLTDLRDGLIKTIGWFRQNIHSFRE